MLRLIFDLDVEVIAIFTAVFPCFAALALAFSGVAAFTSAFPLELPCLQQLLQYSLVLQQLLQHSLVLQL
jgi:hypothetical protein